eukprot:3940941-Rhodomonas_salina.1
MHSRVWRAGQSPGSHLCATAKHHKRHGLAEITHSHPPASKRAFTNAVTHGVTNATKRAVLVFTHACDQAHSPYSVSYAINPHATKHLPQHHRRPTCSGPHKRGCRSLPPPTDPTMHYVSPGHNIGGIAGMA